MERFFEKLNQQLEYNSGKEIEEIQEILKFSNLTEEQHQSFNRNLVDKACVNLHFHPDRYLKDGSQIIDGLIQTGEYLNQYQTQVSSGSLSAKIGGDRDKWENKLFNNLFGSSTKDRPKYGALNLTGTSDGASPRFGSCYFITYPEIKSKCTFTYGDSYLLPKERGTIQNLIQVYARLYHDIFTRNSALGFYYKNLSDFHDKTKHFLESNTLHNMLSHNLDFYIESQIHEQVDLQKDVSTLVVDPSYQGTELENRIHELCDKFDISLIWNQGYSIDLNNFPNNFRGVETFEFAEYIAEENKINAYILGKALSNKKLKSKFKDSFQLAKYTWHCLVKFGE